ncbi:AMP-binding protein [Pseudomonas aeruginosa]
MPPLLQLFIDEPGVAACGSLRRLFSGGEALPAELRNRVLQRLPAVALHNRYGPTETAINVTHWQCRAEDGERSPIGRPLGNVGLPRAGRRVQPAAGRRRRRAVHRRPGPGPWLAWGARR